MSTTLRPSRVVIAHDGMPLSSNLGSTSSSPRSVRSRSQVTPPCVTAATGPFSASRSMMNARSWSPTSRGGTPASRRRAMRGLQLLRDPHQRAVLPELAGRELRDVLPAAHSEDSSRCRDFTGWTVPWYPAPADAADDLIAGRHFGVLVRHLRDGDKIYETYWTTGRGNERMAPSCGLLDLTVHGRQEFWEDSPEGWPQHWGSQGGQFRLDGRPAAQWSRISAGLDDLGATPADGDSERRCH